MKHQTTHCTYRNFEKEVGDTEIRRYSYLEICDDKQTKRQNILFHESGLTSVKTFRGRLYASSNIRRPFVPIDFHYTIIGYNRRVGRWSIVSDDILFIKFIISMPQLPMLWAKEK